MPTHQQRSGILTRPRPEHVPIVVWYESCPWHPTVTPDAFLVNTSLSSKCALHDDQQAEFRKCQSKIDDCNGQAPQTHDDHNKLKELRHGPMGTIFPERLFDRRLNGSCSGSVYIYWGFLNGSGGGWRRGDSLTTSEIIDQILQYDREILPVQRYGSVTYALTHR
jgi:hypothetical protein